MPNEVALKIYPRGFLGRVLDTQLKLQPRPFEARLNALAVKVNIFTPQVNSVDANPIVESLYGQWINRAPETTSFEFRKKVMIAALSALGRTVSMTGSQPRCSHPRSATCTDAFWTIRSYSCKQDGVKCSWKRGHRSSRFVTLVNVSKSLINTNESSSVSKTLRPNTGSQ
jgi:hypothetical protein